MERMIIIVGDIHGKFKTLLHLIKIKKITNADIILAGDCGLGFNVFTDELDILSDLNDYFIEKDITIYMVRGNHDNKMYWDNNLINKSNIKLVKDYEVLELNDRKILCVGGAISVDRKDRVEFKNWWKTEVVDFTVNVLPLRGITDMVIHTAPNYCYPRGSNGFVEDKIKNDPSLRLELMKERNDMARLVDEVKMNNDLKNVFYGHFHQSEIDWINGTRFQLLNINEFAELR